MKSTLKSQPVFYYWRIQYGETLLFIEVREIIEFHSFQSKISTYDFNVMDQLEVVNSSEEKMLSLRKIICSILKIVQYVIRKTVQHSRLYGTQLICKPLSKWNLRMFSCFSEVSIHYSSLASLSAITNNRVRAPTHLSFSGNPALCLTLLSCRKKTMLTIKMSGEEELLSCISLFLDIFFRASYCVCLSPPKFTMECICSVWK